FGLGTVRFAAFLYLNPPSAQKGTNSFLARTAVYVAAIVIEREWRKGSSGAPATPFKKNVKGFLPRLELDACGIRNHPIEIEGHTIKSRRNEAGFARHRDRLVVRVPRPQWARRKQSP